MNQIGLARVDVDEPCVQLLVGQPEHVGRDVAAVPLGQSFRRRVRGVGRASSGNERVPQQRLDVVARAANDDGQLGARPHVVEHGERAISELHDGVRGHARRQVGD